MSWLSLILIISFDTFHLNLYRNYHLPGFEVHNPFRPPLTSHEPPFAGPPSQTPLHRHPFPDHSFHIAVPDAPDLDYLTSRYRLLEISNFEHYFVLSEVEQSRRHQFSRKVSQPLFRPELTWFRGSTARTPRF
jgi:hypothetical protein